MDISQLDISHVDIEVLKNLSKNKKLVQKLARMYDAFSASELLIKQFLRILGPGLNEDGRFPSQATHSGHMVDKVME